MAAALNYSARQSSTWPSIDSTLWLIEGEIPDCLDFLRGDILDLGLENLLARHVIRKHCWYDHLVDPGLLIHQDYRLRLIRTGACRVEPATDEDRRKHTRLPAKWPMGTLVIKNSLPVWVGKLVRPDQLLGWDLRHYIESEYGFSPPFWRVQA